MLAPLLPLTAEEVWRGLTGERSVHLTDWPSVSGESDVALAAAMDRVREVCSTGSALRKASGLRVRLPLSSLTVVVDDALALEPLAGLITDELNVKALVLTDLESADEGSFGVQQTLTVNARAAGPRLGPRSPDRDPGQQVGRLVGWPPTGRSSPAGSLCRKGSTSSRPWSPTPIPRTSGRWRCCRAEAS